jgi:hypothetical protein
MDVELASPIWKAKRAELDTAADEILSISKELAEKTKLVNALKDDLSTMEAEIRVNVCMQMNEQGRPKYANLDAQNAAVLIGMRNQPDKKILLLESLCEIELLKSKLVRLHETRHDTRVEADLIAALIGGE